ncbi:MAG: hypothetical protein ACLR8U_03790 [Oscillospiraceae bacterium]
MQALVNRGCSVAAAKCGRTTLTPCSTAGSSARKARISIPFFFDDNILRCLLAENSRGCELAVIEESWATTTASVLRARVRAPSSLHRKQKAPSFSS